MNQLSKAILFPFLAFVFISGCSGSKRLGTETLYINQAKKDITFKRIFLFAQSKNIDIRLRLENALAEAAAGRGYIVVKSVDAIPPSLQDTGLPNKARILDAVAANNCDALFGISLMSKAERMDFKKGHVAYSKGEVYTWNGGLFGTYTNLSATTNTKDTYTQQKQYFVRSNFYEVSTEQLVFSVESEIVDPTDENRFVKAYMGSVMSQMDDQGLLKPRINQ